MKAIVIIPAFNPDETLLHLVDNLSKMNLKTIVINDGSKKECNTIFDLLKSDYHCNICTHERNLGKGAALKTGIKFAIANDPDCCGFVTADADGQHLPSDILKIAKLLEGNTNDIILGTRDFSNGKIPLKSYLGNRITSFVFQLSTGKKCLDTQTGLRGIPKQYAKACLTIPGSKYEYEMNMLLEMARMGVSFRYVPITTIYLKHNVSSHFHPIKDSVRIYLNILKYSFSSLFSAITDLFLFTILADLIFETKSYSILAATVIARLISGNVNFMLNKHWVFQSKNNYGLETLKYVVLFFCQMMLSWFLVFSLRNLPFHITFIKILVDSILFYFSYKIQKNLIFCSKTKGVNTTNDKIPYKTL